MKRKVVIFCSTFLLVVLLSGCTLLTQEDLDIVQQEVDAIDVYDDTSIKAQLLVIESSLTTLEAESYNDEALQEKVALLQASITSLLTSVEAINETLTESQETDIIARIISIEASLITLSTDLIQSQADILTLMEQEELPSDSVGESNYDYIFDDDGNYITGIEMLNLLSYKYFGTTTAGEFDSCSPTCFSIGSNIFLVNEFYETQDINDYLARYVLFLEELRMYPFYYEHRSGIHLSFNTSVDEYFEHFYFDVSTTTLLNNGFDTSVHEIMNKMFDIRYDSSGNISEAAVQSAYDAYVAADTYAGTVLDIN